MNIREKDIKMVHVSLDVNEEFYSTFEKFLKGFKKEVQIIKTTRDSTLEESLEDIKAGRVHKITNIDEHVKELFS